MALILGGSNEPETDFGETIFLDGSEFEGAGGGGDLDILGGGGDIKAEIGTIIAAIIKGRIGVGLGRGIDKFEGNLVGSLAIFERNDMAGFPSNIGVGFIGAEVGFN